MRLLASIQGETLLPSLTFDEWRISIAMILLILSLGIGWEMLQARKTESGTGQDGDGNRPRLINAPLIIMVVVLVNTHWIALTIALALGWVWQAGTRRGRAELTAWHGQFGSRWKRGIRWRALFHPVSALVAFSVLTVVLLTGLGLRYLGALLMAGA